ncbi:Meiosis regulator and mRNA stability factor 1, partial [Mucuna pruriens]
MNRAGGGDKCALHTREGNGSDQVRPGASCVDGMGSDAGATSYSAAKISVWWDIANCRVPKGQDANSVAQNITSALANINYAGPVSISAYGDTNRIPPPVQHALSSTGVSLNHVPTGAKNANDKKILVDMLLWAVDNPAPANYLLISSDRDFSNALHQLSMRKYNILLAQPPPLCPSLANAAKFVWLWTTLSAGGAPLFVADSDPSSKPTTLVKPKYVRKSIAITPIPPLPEPDESNKNDVPNPEPHRKFFFGAPHEFFASKCNNEPVIPFPTPTSSEIVRHSRHSPLRENQFLSNLTSDMHKLSIRSGVVNSTRQETRDDSRASTSQPDYVQGLVDVVMRTLNFLKVQMILSTEANITDCILYGDPKFRTIDVRKALDFAIEQRRVVKRVCGALHLYLGRNETLWKCVDHMAGKPSDFPQATWNRVKQFLTSSSGRSLFLVSRCRYEAGLILKTSCLEELVLGDLLKILELMITAKKWIIHHHCGWQPITITLMESTGGNADSDFGVALDQI